jgi:cytochrome b561
MKDDLGRYTRVSMALHWSVAGLIGVNVAIGWLAGGLSPALIRPAINLHKSVGLTVLLLVVLRVVWRLTHRPPALDRDMPTVERVAAHGAHAALYVLLFAVPFTGYLHDSAFAQAAQHPLTVFGLFAVPRWPAVVALSPAAKAHAHAVFFAWHVWLNWALYAVLAAHVAGALKHQLVDRKPELQRMWS